MNKSKYIAVALAAAAAFGSSCTDEVPAIPDSELYTREWVKAFGAINPDQDWSAATEGVVNVTTDSPATVKVTAVIQGTNYLLANYSDVSGSRRLTFDIPKGVKEVTVSCGSERVKTTLGGNVSFAASGRTFGDLFTKDDIKFEVTEHKDVFSKNVIDGFIKILPEQENNAGKEYVDYNGDTRKVVSNFSFVGTGEPITFYPLFWNTSSYHALGIYWLDREGDFDPATNMMDLYYTKSGELEYSTEYKEGGTYKGYEVCGTGWGLNNGETCTEHNKRICIFDTQSQQNYWINNGGSWFQSPVYPTTPYHEADYSIESNPGTDWKPVDPEKNESNNGNGTGYRSKGITLTVPKGVHYGFYLKVSGDNSINPEREGTPKAVPEDKVDHIVFSQSKRNETYGTDKLPDVWNCTGQAVHITDKTWAGVPKGDEYVQASFVQFSVDGKAYSCFAFEDWKEAGPDLNDLIFVFDDDYEPEDIPVIDEDEPEPIKWIIACEDLGNKDDFDFNDVVFQIEHVADETTATITPLAAGGTYETYLHREGDANFIGDEWHSNFEGSTGDYKTMLNTYKGRKLLPGKKQTITVPADFSLSPKGRDNYKESMGGFYLKVVKEDGEEISITPPVLKEDNFSVAPQMILIFEPAGKPWRWPKERVNIRDAFNAGGNPTFLDWVGKNIFDASQDGGNWSEFPTGDGYVIDR